MDGQGRMVEIRVKPCRVRVIDCSILSSSSVKVSCLDIEDPGLDILYALVVWTLNDVEFSRVASEVERTRCGVWVIPVGG